MTDNTTIDYAGADGFPMELPIPSTSLQRLIINYMINSSSCLSLNDFLYIYYDLVSKV